VIARPSSTWIGMMRKRGSPDGRGGIDECGVIVQRPIKTAWSASQRKSPIRARVVDSSLYHSWGLFKAVQSNQETKDSGGVSFREARNLLHVNIMREPGMKKRGFDIKVHDFEVEVICVGEKDADTAKLYDRGVGLPKVLRSLTKALSN
jgi:hypothetical protein